MSGLNRMKRRIELAGGSPGVDNRDGKNNKGKLKSFLSALKNSYQAEWITIDGREAEGDVRCLINPDKLKADYDQKILSVEYDININEGDTFLWNRTDTHWIVYLQQDTEEAYFRAQIRKCNYSVTIGDNNYWVYLRGPVETALVWSQKHQIEFNKPNYTMIMYITKNDETLEFFNRFKTMKIDGHNWMVVANDKYSQKGIIEVNIKESYDNEMEDAQIIPEITPVIEDEPHIDGPQFVEAYSENITYTIKNATQGAFVVNSSKAKIVSSDETSCVLKILTGKQESFKLFYRSNDDAVEDISLTITVESF